MKSRRAGFTLFEMVLAIALSAVLLTLIGMAINLYLVRVNSASTRVEEAQLARSILTMIAADIRATSIYQPQDTKGIAQLMAKSSTFDVDSIDAPRETTGNTSGTSSGSGGGSGGSSTGGATSLGSSSGSDQASSSGSADSESENDITMPLGLNGKLDELFVDATHLPRQEELFSAATGYTNAPSPISTSGSTPATQGAASPGVAPPSDLKTVHYYVRAGEAVQPGSASVTSLDPSAQLRVGGLVRQETPRATRVFADKNGGSTAMGSGETVVAPEVVHVEFRYFNGTEIIDLWDMKERKTLPIAVQVAIWLRSPSAANEPIASYGDAAGLANSARQYRQVVYLPMAQVASANQSSSSGGTSSSDTSGSSSSNSSSGSGSSFSSP